VPAPITLMAAPGATSVGLMPTMAAGWVSCLFGR
jgi:hypothetical protein